MMPVEYTAAISAAGYNFENFEQLPPGDVGLMAPEEMPRGVMRLSGDRGLAFCVERLGEDEQEIVEEGVFLLFQHHVAEQPIWNLNWRAAAGRSSDPGSVFVLNTYLQRAHREAAGHDHEAVCDDCPFIGEVRSIMRPAALQTLLQDGFPGFRLKAPV